MSQEESELETETQRLMDEAIKESAIVPGEETAEEESVTQIDVTFQRLQGRMIGLLDSIEDSVQGVEPGLATHVSDIVATLNKQLATAGLGVFASRAAKMVKDELEKSLSADEVLTPVLDTIQECRDSVEDIMTKAGRGATRNVGQSTGNLQARLVQMYATLTEMDKKLESTRSELRKWRGRATELEELLRQNDEVFSTSSSEMTRLQQTIADLKETLGEKDSLISSLKGEVSQAQSQVEQQKQIMASLDSVDQMSAELDSKVQELSDTKGKLAEVSERLSQKETEVETLRGHIAVAAEEKTKLDTQMREIAGELAEIKGSEHDFRSEAEELRTQVRELQARWETLYRVAEEEAAWKAYFLVADKTQWFPLPHLSSALGIPTVLLKRNLQKFVDVGLIEIDDDRVRPRSLSDMVEAAEGMDAQILEEAKADLDRAEDDVVEQEGKTLEYTGPKKGEDYEQEGR
ncbi:hypothetical protein EU546_04120 [Candidatus Thorarchaeota archaeon]|nr:MAG: hypothetical protein EU546_04120 [Candidatus Thorarchaeota archaeon]